MVAYLNKEILTDGDDYLNESIQKNFIHNYVLNKKEIDQFMLKFDNSDSQALVLRKILMSDTSTT